MNGGGSSVNGPATGSVANNRSQMDVNMLYQKVLELSDLLKENREKTRDVVASAESYASRSAHTRSQLSSRPTESSEASVAKISELARENLQLRSARDLLLREQRENSKLLGEYENAIGDILDKIRTTSFEKENDMVRLSEHYNSMLQEEKDAHLQTRLERDECHSRFLQSIEMLRKAHYLRLKEEEEPLKVVSGLQNEVRAYRTALGLDPEKAEEESSYGLLKAR